MPFLVSKSGPEIQRTLNEIANLDLIDTVMTNLNGRKLKTSAEINDTNNRLDKISVELKKLSSIDSIKEKADSLRISEDAKNKSDRTLQTLIASIHLVQECNDKTYILEKKNRCFKDLSKISEQLLDFNRKEVRHDELISLVGKISDHSKEVDSLQKELVKYSGIEELAKESASINTKKEAIKQKKSTLMGIKYITDQIEESKVYIADRENYLHECHTDLVELIGDVCPACGTRKGEVRE